MNQFLRGQACIRNKTSLMKDKFCVWIEHENPFANIMLQSYAGYFLESLTDRPIILFCHYYVNYTKMCLHAWFYQNVSSKLFFLIFKKYHHYFKKMKRKLTFSKDMSALFISLYTFHNSLDSQIMMAITCRTIMVLFE